MAVSHVASPVNTKRLYQYIGNVSRVERAGSGCYKSCISSIEQATILVVLGLCPAWTGPTVGVIHVVSPV